MTAVAPWLRASAFLFLSSLLAPTFCSVVGGWLIYHLYLRPLNRPLSHNQPQETHGLQVIVCGFPRNGTLSLTEALGILGFRCLHGYHLRHPTTAKRYMRAYKSGDPTNWEKLFEGYTAVSDIVGACSYKELAKLYPNAKIILSTRDANQWYTSFSNTVVRHIQGYDDMVFKFVTTYAMWCAKQSFFKQFFHGKSENKGICVTAFLQHVQDVKEHVPLEKLLVFNIDEEEGWTNLCHFLNVPIPDQPFPKTNATINFHDGSRSLGKHYTMLFFIYVVIVACAIIYMV